MIDLSCDNPSELTEIIRYVESDVFTEHCLSAGYPVELRKSLIELSELSLVQRKYVYMEILVELKYLDEKKAPEKQGPSTIVEGSR